MDFKVRCASMLARRRYAAFVDDISLPHGTSRQSGERLCGLIAPLHKSSLEYCHGQQDRHRSRPQGHPAPAAPTGVTVTTKRGQKVSLERGSHTRSKKNPGKRAKKGG